MIYKSRKVALLTIQLEFTPAMARLHKVVRATIDGQFVGYTVVMRECSVRN